MEWAEIKRRLVKEGTSVQVLADLEAVPYKTMYNRIMAHQVKDGVTYLTPENTKGMKKAKAISETKQKQAKEKEKAAGLPEDPAKHGAVDIKNFNCANCANGVKLPPEYGATKYCANGHNYDGIFGVCSEYVTDVLEPFIKAPEESPDVPEDPGKLPEVPPEVYSSASLMPETMDEIERNIEACLQLAARYRQQAEDWKRIRQAFQLSFEGRKLPEVQ